MLKGAIFGKRIMEKSWLLVHHDGGINLEPVKIMNGEAGLVWASVGFSKFVWS